MFSSSRNFQTNIINTLVSCELHDTDVSPALFDAIEKHTLTLFVTSTSHTKNNLLLYPQVESLLYIKNQLVELLSPKTIKEFDQNGICTTKIGGIIGSAVENASIVSMYASEVTFWLDGIIPDHFKKGNTVPQEKFHKNASTKDSDEPNVDKPWIPTIHPVSIVRFPICIPMLKGHKITTGHAANKAAREPLHTYSRSATDWFDSVKKVFQLDFDSLVLTTMSKIISNLKTKCLQQIAPPSHMAQANHTKNSSQTQTK